MRKEPGGRLRNTRAMSYDKLTNLASQMVGYEATDPEAVQKVVDTLNEKGWPVPSGLGAAVGYGPAQTVKAPAPKKPAKVVKPAMPLAKPSAPQIDPFFAAAKSGDLAQLAEASKRDLAGYKADEYTMEPKLDGWRILAHIGEDSVTLFSRSGKTYEDQLPQICAELKDQFPANTVLDGEMVSLHVGEDGVAVDEWGVVQSVLSKNVRGLRNPDEAKITYMVFDVLRLDGHNSRPLPQEDRRDLLKRLFDALSLTKIALIPSYDPSEDQHAMFVEAGFEGSLLKRRSAKYASGSRGAGWEKVKPTETLDAVVMGFREGKSSFVGLVGALVFGQYKDGKLVEVGACSGFDYKTRKEISDNRDEWMGRVIEVKHEASIGNAPRFPRFVRVRTDKRPDQIKLGEN